MKLTKKQRSFNARRGSMMRRLAIIAERERNLTPAQRAARDCSRMIAAMWAKKMKNYFGTSVVSHPFVIEAQMRTNEALRDLGDRVKIRTRPHITTK